MAGETTEPAADPISGLPSISIGHPVTSAEVADALDEDADEDIAPTVAEIVNADKPTEAAVEASRRMLEGLDPER